ncbi:aminodeoxychorismate lyase [Anaerobacillus arseniciselenatis]|uniref:Endolytic murein transglycosylase n=1 Tax=Anaerobacillus arseniciselenatis TaxID=85682 RepID=A0A1S2L5C1_9BACI|nr:endolytic transglycosylase MltG [Anaerobacillus arseniciselenatis]OIJ07678.1 aminodeoxychorismate lyase [Anaerobacillus arseniciselenatis]
MSSKDKQKNWQEIKKKKLKERQEEASIVRKIVLVCLFLFLIAFTAAGYYAYSYVTSALGPVDETDEQLIDVEIPIGSNSTRIGNILEENGLVKNASFFRYYIRYKNETGFQAGDYQLSRSMDLDEIIAALKEGTVYQEYALSFTVPEGRWLERILEIIADNTNHELEEIREKVQDEEYIESLIDRYSILTEDILAEGIRWPLEGYLFPARYDFVEEKPSIETIIEAMLQRTEQIIGRYFADVEESDYNIHEIMTLASIVEGEAQKAEDRYKISGVLYNRLDRNMRLEVDPTVAYAHGEHFSRTLYEHLDIDSPYNTYRVVGIPIGPINNPGEAAIKATLQPEENDYLFFYARTDGEVMYTKTFQEHQEVLREYRD